MGKTFNPFSFYGFTNSPHFEGIGKPVSEEKVQELINSDIELKDKHLIGAEYDSEKNAIVFTVKDGENEELKKYEVPISKILEDEDNGLLSKDSADETYATKEEIGDMLTKTEADDTYLKEHQDVSMFFDSVEYDSEEKKIVFKNGDETKGEIDATDFIKDGIVDTVEIEDGKLIITFNTDSEKEAIELEIKDIFDADNYLTKDEIADEYQPKGDYVEYTKFDGTRKTIQLENRDSISGKIKAGGGANLIMLSAYDGLDFDVTEVGSTQTALVLNTCEGVVKIEGADHTQKTIATTDEIDDMLTKTEAADTYQAKGNYLTEHQDISGLATKAEIPSLDGYATEAWVNSKNYLTEHQSLADYAKTSEVESALEEKQDKGDYAAYTTFEGTRKTISLGNRDTISAVTPKGGSQIAMVSDYDGLDFPVVELGGQNGALVLNTREDRVKVEVVENGKRVQHSVATLDDLNDYPKYEAYVNEAQGINKKTIVLENDDNISGKRTDGLGVNLVEVSRWDVADFGSKSVHINLNGQYERPTYNDNKGIALLDDVEGLKAEMKDYFNALLKNYTLKSDEDIAKVIKAGGDVVVAKDIKATSGYTLTKNADIDLNGHTLDAVSNGQYGDNIVIGNGANVTIKNGVINEAENATQENASAVILIKTTAATTVTLEDVEVTGGRPVYLNNANENTTVTIKSGTFTCDGENGEAIYVQQGGKVTIEGGYFSNPNATEWKGFLLNIKDTARQGKDPREFIEVKGGTFENFDPSNNKAEGEGTNFVADGYHVEITQEGENTLYTVVKD